MKRFLKPLLAFLAFLVLPQAALAGECQGQETAPHGFASVNSSQLFDDGFQPGGDNPTVKATASIPIEGCIQTEVFVNKEVGGTASDELDVGLSYTIPVGKSTELRLFGSYYAMRELPDIIDTTASVTQNLGNGESVKVVATLYTFPAAADGYRLTASYTQPITKRLSLEVGILHEGGLGLPESINAFLIKPRFDLGNNLSLSGKVVIPTQGGVRAALSLGWGW